MRLSVPDWGGGGRDYALMDNTGGRRSVSNQCVLCVERVRKMEY